MDVRIGFLEPKRKLPPFRPFFLAVILALIITVLIFSQAHAEEINLAVIAQIESSNNPLAYNAKSRARGLYQITPICLKDYNSQNSPKISPTSLFDPQKAYVVAKWYLTQRIPLFCHRKGIPITVANVLWAYSAGIGNVVKGNMPKETQDYIKKYYRLTEKNENLIHGNNKN